MVIRSAEHELHQRRKSRNLGTLLALVALVVILAGLTIVKIAAQDKPASHTGSP